MKQTEIRYSGNPCSENLIIRVISNQNTDTIPKEAELLKQLVQNEDWHIAAVPVLDWNQSLAPWPAPPVFGRQRFGNGAPDTLKLIIELLNHHEYKRCFLCGYSLGGLFALWAATQTNIFDGIAAVSPSVWYPDWLEHVQEHHPDTGAVYLSLGDEEANTRHPVLSTVKTAIEHQYQILSDAGIDTAFEWNPGNHFKDTELRCAKGMAWLLSGNIHSL